jgi:alkanesulfonate monooxygenase SsuD/methylene tetrahydromethanopterin reductase-like flavin-dependent oxidoreductase (luciferase family)
VQVRISRFNSFLTVHHGEHRYARSSASPLPVALVAVYGRNTQTLIRFIVGGVVLPHRPWHVGFVF